MKFLHNGITYETNDLDLTGARRFVEIENAKAEAFRETVKDQDRALRRAHDLLVVAYAALPDTSKIRNEIAAEVKGQRLASIYRQDCPHCGRELDGAEAAPGQCDSDDCPRGNEA